MCFIRKRIKKLEDSITELTKIVKTREYNLLKEESKELHEIKELLDQVKIEVKDAKLVLDQDSMEEILTIQYQLPNISLRFDENGDPYKNNVFYAINALNLISLEDMEKIRKLLYQYKTKEIQK